MPSSDTIPMPEDYTPGFYWGRYKDDKSWTLIIQILEPDVYSYIRTHRVINPENEVISHGKEWWTRVILGPPIDHPKDTFNTYDHQLGMYV
jgi:hypothetical protein